jgi:hypothetical protein
MARVAAGVLVVAAACFAAGCREDDPPGGSEPRLPLPFVGFVTSDLSTSVHLASLRISNNGRDVPLDLVNTVVAQLRVSTWPGDVPVAASATVATFPGEQLANGGLRAGYGQIDLTLDAALDGSGWYGVSLPERRTNDYQVSNDLILFTFAGGALGVRISPAHPPVVSSAKSCAPNVGPRSVYVAFSEPVTKPSGALTLDYGLAHCAVGDDQPSVTQFSCTNAALPFLLHIADGVTAAASGSPMAAGTLSSEDMQWGGQVGDCTHYKRVIVD